MMLSRIGEDREEDEEGHAQIPTRNRRRARYSWSRPVPDALALFQRKASVGANGSACAVESVGASEKRFPPLELVVRHVRDHGEETSGASDATRRP